MFNFLKKGKDGKKGGFVNGLGLSRDLKDSSNSNSNFVDNSLDSLSFRNLLKDDKMSSAAEAFYGEARRREEEEKRKKDELLKELGDSLTPAQILYSTSKDLERMRSEKNKEADRVLDSLSFGEAGDFSAERGSKESVGVSDNGLKESLRKDSEVERRYGEDVEKFGDVPVTKRKSMGSAKEDEAQGQEIIDRLVDEVEKGRSVKAEVEADDRFGVSEEGVEEGGGKKENDDSGFVVDYAKKNIEESGIQNDNIEFNETEDKNDIKQIGHVQKNEKISKYKTKQKINIKNSNSINEKENTTNSNYLSTNNSSDSSSIVDFIKTIQKLNSLNNEMTAYNLKHPKEYLDVMGMGIFKAYVDNTAPEKLAKTIGENYNSILNSGAKKLIGEDAAGMLDISHKKIQDKSYIKDAIKLTNYADKRIAKYSSYVENKVEEQFKHCKHIKKEDVSGYYFPPHSQPSKAILEDSSFQDFIKKKKNNILNKEKNLSIEFTTRNMYYAHHYADIIDYRLNDDGSLDIVVADTNDFNEEDKNNLIKAGNIAMKNGVLIPLFVLKHVTIPKEQLEKLWGKGYN